MTPDFKSDLSKDELALLKPETATLTSPLPYTDVVANLQSIMDKPANVMTLGQTPGSRPFVGSVSGSQFVLSKKSHALNPFARKLCGSVKEVEGGVAIEYRFEKTGMSRLLFTGLTISAIPVATIIFLLSARDSVYPFFVLAYLGVVVATMILFGVILKITSNLMCYGADEEILDVVKRAAAGATPAISD